MAHLLRYYKELEQPNGDVVRLEIHEKNGTAPAVPIGKVVQALQLDIQGSADAIDAPIVKTSVKITLVDAPDLNDGKCGNWTEFYTPDSTKWKVVLLIKPLGGTFHTIWGGYITPDSYSEKLCYRGSVTITARDNIGHLQDFPFDMAGNKDGMITLEELLLAAWRKIESPMTLDIWRDDSAKYLLANGIEAPYTYMNVSAFQDMSYYEAIEKALFAYGLVMRYTEKNTVCLMSLRDLPYQGKYSNDVRYAQPIFAADAERELAPAAKRIEEKIKYDIVSSVSMPQVTKEDFTGAVGTYRCKIDGIPASNGGVFGRLEHDAPIHPIISNAIWGDVAQTTLFFNPNMYEIGYFLPYKTSAADVRRYTYIAANNVDSRSVVFRKRISAGSFVIRIKFGNPIVLDREYKLEMERIYNLSKIEYIITAGFDGVTKYYSRDGRWEEYPQNLVREYDNTLKSYDFQHVVNLGEHIDTEVWLTINRIEYVQQGGSSLQKYGLYACIHNISIDIPDAVSLLEANNVNTNYNDINNIIISREPKLGPAYNPVAIPQFITNGIYIRNIGAQTRAYLPASQWAWSSNTTPQQLAVYNHLQLLCYHAKPNNIISGDIVNADFLNTACVYQWNGANHILVSGTYNYLNGIIESAVLREFTWYSDMWDDISGSEMPQTEEASQTTAESNSGASATTHTNTTDVYVGNGSGGGGVTMLGDLTNVQLTDLKGGQSLVYDEVANMWINAMIAGGGPAVLEESINTGIAVGFIPKGTTLAQNLTLTQILQMMFSQAITMGAPKVTIISVPQNIIEVGSTVNLNLSASYTDGVFRNTYIGTVVAGCKPGKPIYYLDGVAIGNNHTFVANAAKVYHLRVEQPYEQSTAEIKNVSGEIVPEVIRAGIATSEANIVIGYKWFWGNMTDEQYNNISSESIRQLDNQGFIDPTLNSVTLLNVAHEITAGQDIIIAVPNDYVLSQVKDPDTNSSFAVSFAVKAIEINCAGDAVKTYNLYRFDNKSAYPLYINLITIERS